MRRQLRSEILSCQPSDLTREANKRTGLTGFSGAHPDLHLCPQSVHSEFDQVTNEVPFRIKTETV